MKFSGLAAALALTAALAGCQDEPEPKFTDPTETPPSETTETSGAADQPKRPRAQERAFVNKLVDAMEVAGREGDLAQVRGLWAESCENCLVLAGNIRKAFRDGGRIEGLEWGLIKSRFKGRESGASVWLADVESAEETWFDGDGNVVNSVPAGINYYEFHLVRTEGRVQLAEFYFVEP